MFVTKTSLNILNPTFIREIKHFLPLFKCVCVPLSNFETMATFHETSYESYAIGKYPNMELLQHG